MAKKWKCDCCNEPQDENQERFDFIFEEIEYRVCENCYESLNFEYGKNK